MNTLALLLTLGVALSTALLIAKVVASRSGRPSAGPSPPSTTSTRRRS